MRRKEILVILGLSIIHTTIVLITLAIIFKKLMQKEKISLPK